MLQGWTTKTAAELDATIRTWDEVLEHYRIPLDAYPALYKHAFDTRQKAMANGGRVPDFDATLFVAGWSAVRDEIRERDIAERRYLPSTAASDCDKCFGAGMRNIDGKGFGKCECRG